MGAHKSPVRDPLCPTTEWGGMCLPPLHPTPCTHLSYPSGTHSCFPLPQVTPMAALLCLTSVSFSKVPNNTVCCGWMDRSNYAFLPGLSYLPIQPLLVQPPTCPGLTGAAVWTDGFGPLYMRPQRSSISSEGHPYSSGRAWVPNLGSREGAHSGKRRAQQAESLPS